VMIFAVPPALVPTVGPYLACRSAAGAGLGAAAVALVVAARDRVVPVCGREATAVAIVAELFDEPPLTVGVVVELLDEPPQAVRASATAAKSEISVGLRRAWITARSCVSFTSNAGAACQALGLRRGHPHIDCGRCQWCSTERSQMPDKPLTLTMSWGSRT
jgi:hypothetical protein